MSDSSSTFEGPTPVPVQAPLRRPTPEEVRAYLRSVPNTRPRPRRRGPLLHLALFAATFLTTAMTSAVMQGAPILSDPATILTGFPYAIAVMSILLFHECGHYLFARAYRVDATLPFFIPFFLPAPFFQFGTLGAFIRMRTLPWDRRQLFDIGAAGPWAGLLLAVPAVIIGLSLSEVRPLDPSEGGFILGDSLLFSWLVHLVLGVSSENVTILLHPVALAGWFGLFVTCLNLLPMGQLDGGHVAYAVFGRYHRWISRGVITFLIVLGIGGSVGWFVFAGLVYMLGLDHPPPPDSATPLDRRRMVMAALTLAVFILTFMPVPIDLIEPTEPLMFEGERVPISAPARPAPGMVFPL